MDKEQTAAAADTHGHSTRAGCVISTHNLAPHACDANRHNAAGHQQRDARETPTTRKYRYPGQSLAEFPSPSTALCNAPFNAPCSPVTPLLLVIAWYCAVLPCAASCRPPQSPHTTQQAPVVCAEASVRGQRWDFQVEYS